MIYKHLFDRIAEPEVVRAGIIGCDILVPPQDSVLWSLKQQQDEAFQSVQGR